MRLHFLVAAAAKLFAGVFSESSTLTSIASRARRDRSVPNGSPQHQSTYFVFIGRVTDVACGRMANLRVALNTACGRGGSGNVICLAGVRAMTDDARGGVANVSEESAVECRRNDRTR